MDLYYLTVWILLITEHVFVVGKCGNVSLLQESVEENGNAEFHFTPTERYKTTSINWLHEFLQLPNKTNVNVCPENRLCNDSRFVKCSSGTGLHLSIQNVSTSDNGFYIVHCGDGVYSNRVSLSVIPRSKTVKVDSSGMIESCVLLSTTLNHSKISETNIYRTSTLKPQTDTGHDVKDNGKTLGQESTGSRSSTNTPQTRSGHETDDIWTSDQGTTGYRSSTNYPVTDTERDFEAKEQYSEKSRMHGFLTGGAIGLIMAVLIGVVIIKARKRCQQKKVKKGLASGTGENNISSNESQENQTHRNDLQSAAEASDDPSGSIGVLTTKHIEPDNNSEVRDDKNAEYTTVVPKRQGHSGNDKSKEDEKSEAIEDQNAEYATVVKKKQRQSCQEQSHQTSDKVKERQLTYADLVLVSRPQSVPCTRQQEVTEYVSIDIVKTATLKQKQTL